MLGESGGVLGDQAVAVELGQAVRDGSGGFVGQDGAADQRAGDESGAVEQLEDRVVLVVEAGQLVGAVELAAGPISLMRSRNASSRRLSGAGGRSRSAGGGLMRCPTIRRIGLSSSLGGGGGGS